VRALVKQWPWARPLRLLNLELRNTFRALPQWRALAGPDEALWNRAAAAADGPKVLIATSVGSHSTSGALDSVLAAGLTLRGARVRALLCDGALAACLACEKEWWPDHQHFLQHGPARTLCGPCYRPARRMWSRLGLPVDLFSRDLDRNDRDRCWQIANAVPEDEIDALEFLGARVGMHARAGTLRYFATGNFDDEPDALPVRRRYLAAALMTATALDRLFQRERFDACVAHHGVYVPQGLMIDMARKHGTRLVTWNIAYRAGSFIFSHDDSYHFTLMDEPVSHWEGLGWNGSLQAAIDDYMLARASGAKDWISYQDGVGESAAEIKAKYGVDFSKPTISAFTNVIWDAQVYYKSNAFPNMLEWLFETVRYFDQRRELQLVIRVHPAEVLNPLKSRQTAVAELARAFPQLPPNVYVIPPEARVNSYAVAQSSNAAIIYGTKMGIELAYMGIPTIVAGESWARNKGFTLDADSRDAYFALLDTLPLPGRLDADTRRRAAKYAFHFFFRRTIPLDFLTVKKGAWPPFQVDLERLDPLQPGHSAGLDVICGGILRGEPFVYRAEDGLR
jgi:hypothetical protein